MLLDLLMTRYDMNYFDNLDYDDGLELIREALEQKRKEEHWDIYLAKYPSMDEKSYIPFDKFYKRISEFDSKSRAEQEMNKKIDQKQYASDAIALAEKIKKAHQSGQN